MADIHSLTYTISDPIELNLSYMPFITNGGLFVPTFETLNLGEEIKVELQFPSRSENILIEGMIIWITFKNALHHVLPGVGIQFIGINSQAVRTQIEGLLDKTIEVGGYTYGITDTDQKNK